MRRLHGDAGAVSFTTEPVTLMSAINAAIGSTVGILTLTQTIEPEVGGAIATALGAWILVASLLITRPAVQPNATVDAKVQAALYTPVPAGEPPAVPPSA